MSRYTFWFCIIGILITASGILLKNPDEYPHVRRILTPEYVKMTALYHEMKKDKDFIIDEQNAGFHQLVILIRTALHTMTGESEDPAAKEHLQTILLMNINKIQVLKYMPYAMMKNGAMAEWIQVKVSSSDNRDEILDLYKLGELIDTKYKDHPLFRKSPILIWSGLALILLSLLFEEIPYWFYWK
jgi:hypothetical protein